MWKYVRSTYGKIEIYVYVYRSLYIYKYVYVYVYVYIFAYVNERTYELITYEIYVCIVKIRMFSSSFRGPQTGSFKPEEGAITSRNPEISAISDGAGSYVTGGEHGSIHIVLKNEKITQRFLLIIALLSFLCLLPLYVLK